MKSEKEILRIIRDARKAKNLSQAELAFQIGLTQSTYAKIEKGVVGLSIFRFQKIKKTLDIAPEKFFELEDLGKQSDYDYLLKLSQEMLSFKESQIKKLQSELSRYKNIA